jgi:hypothetical protein
MLSANLSAASMLLDSAINVMRDWLSHLQLHLQLAAVCSILLTIIVIE